MLFPLDVKDTATDESITEFERIYERAKFSLYRYICSAFSGNKISHRTAIAACGPN